MWSNIIDRLKNGEWLYGTMVRFVREPGIVNLVVNAGFDFMLVDMEHSVFSFETTADIVRAARGFGIPVVVRPPARVKFYLSRLLDAGANGLMIPMTETREHADEIREACYYRPVGKRGCAGMLGQTDYQKTDPRETVENANRKNLIVAQIESVKGVENIESIVATEGIDAVIVGPYDLSDSLGIVGQITSSAVNDMIVRVIEACKKHGKISGIHSGSVEQLKYWKERGMQLLAYQTDVNLLYDAYVAGIEKLHSD